MKCIHSAYITAACSLMLQLEGILVCRCLFTYLLSMHKCYSAVYVTVYYRRVGMCTECIKSGIP